MHMAFSILMDLFHDNQSCDECDEDSIYSDILSAGNNSEHCHDAIFYLNTSKVTGISHFLLVQNMTETSNSHHSYTIQFTEIA